MTHLELEDGRVVIVTEGGKMLLQITAPYFTAGIATEYRQGDGDVVTVAALIVDYMESWSLERVARYCRKKKWKVEIIDD